ncbi:MAG: SurA N-terminal domain-containing protein [Paludisphaera borealis]|uniref:SurA N-terminal domain-containing protein n=1 Tax=Paludisphaera borealis TaxID=1387353 RepID=UPI002844C3B9|nr:SurA N-terminal domain-containing protein [Paludisphaera borealis]MDR3622894.1 SurA N-terminal domain-containing protein [Paludisphaera borealis]
MPFEVFRRNQRVLIAVFGIMAMISFVLSDSLPRLLNAGNGGRDQEVAKLYGKSVYRSELNEMARQRSRANQFLNGLMPYMRDQFGSLKDRELVDALILEHEADRLGMTATPAVGREWLKTITQGRMNRELFEMLYSRFSSEISQEQLLTDIANQVRIRKVRGLLGYPMVTPYDVYESYRDQTERVADKIVEVPVENFLTKVGEPSDAEIKTLYDQYKDVLPDPSRETPGFKVPRQVQVEFLSLDGNAKARGYRDKLTDAELQTYYENHKTEFKVPSELPDDLFADGASLTPPVLQPFSEVKGFLAPRLADEKAQTEINETFNRIRDEVLIPFADEYLSALDDQEDAKKQGAKTEIKLPAPLDLKAVAQKEGVNYEITPLLSRDEAERYGQISTAEVGTTRLSGGRKFSEEFTDPKISLYEPVELTDILGTRFLARKVKDEAPRVPPLDEVKSDVILAWKQSKARPLAEKAAEALAAQIKEKGGKIAEDKVDGYRVISIPPITRTQMGGMPSSPFEPTPQVETTIPEVPLAGDAFRDAYFGVKPGETDVAPNLPKTVYYVVALDRREPANFTQLYDPIKGEEFRFKMLTTEEAGRRQDDNWMAWLRKQAGLPADWVPADEAKKDLAANG